MKITFILLCLGLASQQMRAQTIRRESISLDAAKQISQGAEREAERLQLGVTVAILDEAGHLVYLQRMNDAPLASIQVAQQKARTAIYWKTPSKNFEDWLQGGMTRLLTLPTDQTLIEGGIPIVFNGKVIGSVGVSGGSSQQDAQIAQAGISTLQK